MTDIAPQRQCWLARAAANAACTASRSWRVRSLSVSVIWLNCAVIAVRLAVEVLAGLLVDHPVADRRRQRPVLLEGAHQLVALVAIDDGVVLLVLEPLQEAVAQRGGGIQRLGVLRGHGVLQLPLQGRERLFEIARELERRHEARLDQAELPLLAPAEREVDGEQEKESDRREARQQDHLPANGEIFQHGRSFNP